MLPPVGIEPRPFHNLWFQFQHSPFWTNLAFACKTETLGYLYSHALLILTKSSKSKKSSGVWTEDLLSSTCLTSSENANIGILLAFRLWKTRLSIRYNWWHWPWPWFWPMSYLSVILTRREICIILWKCFICIQIFFRTHITPLSEEIRQSFCSYGWFIRIFNVFYTHIICSKYAVPNIYLRFHNR